MSAIGLTHEFHPWICQPLEASCFFVGSPKVFATSATAQRQPPRCWLWFQRPGLLLGAAGFPGSSRDGWFGWFNVWSGFISCWYIIYISCIYIYIYLYTSFPHPLIPVIPAFELYWVWNCKGFQVPRCEKFKARASWLETYRCFGGFQVSLVLFGCHDVGMATPFVETMFDGNVPTDPTTDSFPQKMPMNFRQRDHRWYDLSLLEVLLVSGMLAFSFPTLYLGTHMDQFFSSASRMCSVYQRMEWPGAISVKFSTRLEYVTALRISWDPPMEGGMNLYDAGVYWSSKWRHVWWVFGYLG